MRAVLRPGKNEEHAGEQRDQHREKEDGRDVQVHLPAGILVRAGASLADKSEDLLGIAPD